MKNKDRKPGKRRACRWIKYTRCLFVSSLAVFIVGVVYLNSVESSLNIRYQNLKLDIQSLEEKIESLDMEQVELKSLKRLELIAAKKGYFYNLDTEIAVVCKENK